MKSDTKSHIIKNLRRALRVMKKSGDEPTTKENIWKNELIAIEDAIQYLEDLP